MPNYNRHIRRAKSIWPSLGDVTFQFKTGKGATEYEYGVRNGSASVVRVTLLIPEDCREEDVVHELSKEIARLLGKESQFIEEELCAS